MYLCLCYLLHYLYLLQEAIHLIPKWRQINYSFVCKLISLLCLFFDSKFFCVLYMLTRQRGLINAQTKKLFIGRHFGIRCTHWQNRKTTMWPFSQTPPQTWERLQGCIQTSSPTLQPFTTSYLKHGHPWPFIAWWQHGKLQKSGTKVHLSNWHSLSPWYK